MNICPVNAIKAEADPEGFLCPLIDKSKCISCGKCARICPILRKKKIGGCAEPKCYAAWSKDENIRFQSTSGGVFTHLAESIIDEGGAVAGARYRSDNLVEHALIRKKEDIEQLRQSKYVQSDIGLLFREVKDELKNGRPLLFSGTPCQCAGLRSYLEKEYDNLYLCDFICRGVNSPLVYLKYLNELEEKYGSKVKRVWFKNKTFGWNNFATKIIFEDGQEYIADRETDPFMLGYIKSKTTLYMRASCYQCHFKGVSRNVDITLGDFWGVNKVDPKIDSYNGVSVVMLHSFKGDELFQLILKNLSFENSSLIEIIHSNPCIEKSVTRQDVYNRFWNNINYTSFSKNIKSCINNIKVFDN
ncbi:MAG: Coenzyme F420 hydrogenase/dehydrogenase, beta subunit C-terminal domain [Bacteroides sp.]|nr:Coenzyme F420 hydrogenase/dehydrogenase, beta subunit C-terminal domain [Bacteroides sp.]